ncbi:DUF2194 domain-containing protein [Pectinatus haikarae]|uniref:DUF2194 domain-containing protein n=1 Tax=Pectinatus haikarae TaxID=349096 RepID=UPI0018C4D1E7|nr:DUF2194 domain-containing protein [Pectinatus haikarae]
MYKKNLFLAVLIIFAMGLFFQFNRMDVLLHLFKSKNVTNAVTAYIKEPDSAKRLTKDRFLIIYDNENVYSTFLKYRLQTQIEHYMKKDADVITINDSSSFPAKDYSAVLWAAERFDNEVLWNSARQYADNGGTLEIMTTGGIENAPALYEPLGISNVNGSVTAAGINMTSTLLLGTNGFKMAEGDTSYNTYALNCELQPAASVYFTSTDSLPLAWEKKQGNGKIIVYNGTELYAKKNLGILTALLSQSQDDFLFPVSATKTVFIDDFPAPVPDGDFSKIYAEYGLATADFYERIWWPYMLETAKKYDLKYTGAIIETYNDEVTGDFRIYDQNARRNLIKYGRELLNSGGELGIHGYNHQSLVGAGYGVRKYLGYNIWENQKEMENSLSELKRYIADAFPGYEVHAYIPPSNVFSPEGKAAVKKIFPSIKAYASMYEGNYSAEKVYYQDFKQNEDGTFEFPRLSAGYNPDRSMYYSAINGLNAYGIFSHFVHPDEIFYEENGNNRFSDMENGFDRFMEYFTDNYIWLRSTTLSDTLKYFGDYLSMDYKYQEKNNVLHIDTWNYQYEPSYILRSTKKIRRYEGCDITKIQNDAYYIKIKSSEAAITFDEE